VQTSGRLISRDSLIGTARIKLEAWKGQLDIFHGQAK